MAYKHGVYGEAHASNYRAEETIGTLPVYVGSLPIQRINANGAADFDYKEYINKPMLIESYKQVNGMGIYSDDWDAYTLCEALRAHFMNGDDVAAPIVLINVLDPTKALAAEATTATVSVNKEGKAFVGYIDDPLCSIDDMAITADGVEFASGDVTYAYDGDRVMVSIVKEGFDKASVSASYKRIDFDAADLSASDFQSAVDAVDIVEPVTGMIPTILGAPTLSKIPELHDIMIQKAKDKAAEKWNLICVTDIPASAGVNTKDLAMTWKKENAYNSKYEKPFWPRVENGGYLFHMSTVAAAKMQLTDAENGNVPYESASNKVIPADKVVLDDGAVIFMKESEANELNAVGISTVNFIKQTVRLWGSHMGNYDHAKISSIKPEDRFDVQIRMLGFILNYLQYNYLDEVDGSFSRKDIDNIKNSAQTWLDSLVNDGALLYAEINFDEAYNTVEDLEAGNITFDLEVTYPVVAKSITFRAMYTRAGLVVLTAGGEE